MGATEQAKLQALSTHPLIFTVILSGNIVKMLKHSKLDDIDWFSLATLELGSVFQWGEPTWVA